jgi:uncharacterized RDD family membrane protein YckC
VSESKKYMSELQINTSQNVNISFTSASLGERILAYLLDAILIIAYLYGAFQIAKALNILNFDDYWSNAAIYSLLMLPVMLYTLLQEIYLEGQTLGKKVLKIKVVKIDGYQASVLDFFIRWVFRLIDIFLIFGTGGVAIISIAISKNSQRIGGMASGTAVISIKNRYSISHTILEEVNNSYKATYRSVINLSDKDMQIIKDMYHIAIKSKDYKTLNKLRIKVEEITKTSKASKTNMEYLKIIMKDYTHFTQDM